MTDRAGQKPDEKLAAEKRRKDLADVLKDHFNRSGLNQTQLAIKLNVDKSTVSKTINGEVAPRSKNQLKRWIDVLRIRGAERKLLLAMYDDEDDQLATRWDVRVAGEDTASVITGTLHREFSEFTGALVDTVKPLVEQVRASAISQAGDPSESIRRNEPGDKMADSDPRRINGERLLKTIDEFWALYRRGQYPAAADVALDGARAIPPFDWAFDTFAAAAFEEAGELERAKMQSLAVIRNPRAQTHELNAALRIYLRAGDYSDVTGVVDRLMATQRLDAYTALEYADRLARAQLESRADPYIEYAYTHGDPVVKAGSLYLRAIQRLRSRRFDEAADLFGQSAEIGPDVWQAIFAKGAAYLEGERFDKCADTWAALAKDQPDLDIGGENIHMYVALAREFAGDEVAALADREIACSRNPTPKSFEGLVLQLYGLKQHDKLIEWGELARTRRIATAITNFLLGFTYFTLWRNCQAIDPFHDALRDATDLPPNLVDEIEGQLLPLAQARCDGQRGIPFSPNLSIDDELD